MTPERKKKLPLVLAAGVFLLGGLDGLYFQEFLVGTASLLAGVLNLVAVRYVNSSPRLVGVCMHAVNALVAVALTVSAIMAGKQYIQFAWLFVACLFAIAAVVTGLRHRGRSRES